MEGLVDRSEWFLQRFVHVLNSGCARVFMLYILCCASFICLSEAAPPNPHLFFDVDSRTGVWTPKPGQSQATFFSALEGCCFAREQSIMQTDGVEYVLAVKIDFSDQPGQRSGMELYRFLFATEAVSLKTYYREVSYGQMDVQPGPAGGLIPGGDVWVRATKPMTYYGEGRINEDRYKELAREACAGVDAIVDFSQYDRDKDGVVDHLFIIHSGDDEASTAKPEAIWSILVRNINSVFDGVRVDSAVVVAEEPSFVKPHLGIYFHEFFHDFGAPDVYGPNFIDSRDHKWGLMGAFGPYQGDLVDGIGNGLKPSHIIGYLKWDFDARPENGRLGWIQPVEIEETEIELVIPSFELPWTGNNVFKIALPGKVDVGGESMEFFLIENRYRESGAIFDTHLPESGILIWHVDETNVRARHSFDAAGQIWLEDPNDPEHLGIHPYKQGVRDLLFITDGAAFSANDTQTSFTPASRPNSNANDGTGSGISITNIGFEGQSMSLFVSFGDTYEPNNSIETAFPIEFNQTYESFLFDVRDERDVYRLDVIPGQTIMVNLSDIPANLDYGLFLLDSVGRKIVEGESLGGSSDREIIFKVHQTDILYVLVESFLGFSDRDSYHLLVGEGQVVSAQLRLTGGRVFPNPVPVAHPEVTFGFAIPDFQLAESIELEIFDSAGHVVHVDVQKNVVGSGRFLWDIARPRDGAFSSGVYLYVISATRGEQTVRFHGKVAVVR